MAAEYVGIIFGRLNAHTAIARNEALRGEELWGDPHRAAAPAHAVDRSRVTGGGCGQRIRGGLSAAQGRYSCGSRFVRRAKTFVIRDILQELIVGADGEAPSTVMRIEDDLRLARARVLHVMHKERRLALLTIEDATEIFCVRSALDSSEYASVVVDPKGRVLTFNKLIIGLLGGAEVGMEAARAAAAGGSWIALVGARSDGAAQNAYANRIANLPAHDVGDPVARWGIQHICGVVPAGRQWHGSRPPREPARRSSRAR